MSTSQIPIERHTASYKYDYFSGANIGIYVRDILVASAVAVQFDLSQNKMPLYGYASDLWDGVAMGTVQCSGVLVVNFQYAQYVPTLIARVHNKSVSAADLSASNFARGIERSNMKMTGMVDQPIDPNTPLTSSQKSELRKIYWRGDPSSSRSIHNALSNTNLSRPDEHSLPFDILVTYGDAFGNELRNQDGLPSPTLSAVRKLHQVQILGFGQQVSVGGEPVREHYAFICRQVT